MKKNPERLDFMANQFQKLGMDFTIQEGIDGSAYHFEEYNAGPRGRRNDGIFMTAGIKGCALSHKMALEKMIADNLDYALVMEDDVELSDNFKKIMGWEMEKRERGETSWEYLSFNYPSVGMKSVYLWLFLFSEMMKKNRKKAIYWIKLPVYFLKFIGITIMYSFEKLREMLYKRIYLYGKPAKFYRPLYLAGCYLITKEGAEKIVALNSKLMYAADEVPNIARTKKLLKFYAFVPLVARQKRETFPSELNNEHFGKKVISY